MWWVLGRRVLLTSVPKCGTHLVRQLLGVMSLPASCEVDWEIGAAELAVILKANRGRAVVGHVPVSPPVYEMLARLGARIVFITRDPRDQVVSHLYYFRREERHPVHPYFRDRLADDGAALLAIIRGIEFSTSARVTDVNTLFRSFLGWNSHPCAYGTTFERLVGPLGGGTHAAQLAEVAGIMRHIGFPVAPRLAAEIAARRVYSPASPTFRTGQIGGWRQHFEPRHREAFKEVAGQLLVDLGYERDLDW